MLRLALAVLFAVCIPAAVARADEVDDVVRRYMAASHIPGAAVAVIKDGRTVRTSSYGVANLEWPGPVTADTPFQIASVSKVFGGIVLMRLVDKGLIQLDAPIDRYLGAVPDGWRPITVRHLASHTSGLPEGLGMPSSATPQQVLEAAKGRPLAYTPGAESRYGLTDFVVLTAVMERVSGLTYAELLKREVIEPLKLTRTGFAFVREDGRVRTAEVIPGRASVYAWRDGVQRDESYLYPVFTYSAGGLFASVRDIATLFTALDSGGYLSAGSLRELMTPARLNDGATAPFGIGWTVGTYRGEPVVGHTGGPALADIVHLPERSLTVISLVNQRRFYPLLSKSIADLSLPSTERTPGIRDTRPELTAVFRATLQDAASGRVDSARFGAKGAGAIGFLQDFGNALLAAVGPIKGVELLAERPEGDETRRVYRVTFERRVQPWVARTARDGAILELRPDE
ncbi:serine hydrolase domain-containing protein [Phenylobacterium kunshanense]|uniref:Beta-lactamase-related domain-containing protein n=1 Tax=Phenylobacterium kunshanense TaxID=1445034 RepID=A0A328BC31_9CAUL|nr:serine hydrolase domain-containing protein [Phenylobacterium kunshanense]RAK63354.1 hypothetical protein DJ019_16640 [Phenylobacterium kunshanense]